jgi:hypothetical protein
MRNKSQKEGASDDIKGKEYVESTMLTSHYEQTNKVAAKMLTIRAAVIIGLVLAVAQWAASASYGKYSSGYWFWETKAEVSSLKSENRTLYRRYKSVKTKLTEETNAKVDAQMEVAKLTDLRELDEVERGLADASHVRLEGEVTRLTSENAGLAWKNSWKEETVKIMYAVLRDNPIGLERSRTMNVLRDGPLEFINWSHPDHMVEAMLKLEAWKCLEWVVEQPRWYSCLNTDTHCALVKWEEGHKKDQALQIYNDLPLLTQQAIDHLAESVRKNGAENTLIDQVLQRVIDL